MGGRSEEEKKNVDELRGNISVFSKVLPDHLLLDSAPNLGPLISHWEINKFENC